MANLQIKGIDEALYQQIKELAASENRSIGQQILYLVKTYLAKRRQFEKIKLPAETLLELSGSWADERSPEKIVSQIKGSRKNSRKLKNGF